MSMLDVSFCFLEAIGERVSPRDQIVGVLPCYFFLERSQDMRDAGSGHLERFIQSEEAPHVLHLGDVFRFHIGE